MDLDIQESPQKLRHQFIFNYQANNTQSSVSPCHYNKRTLKNSDCLKKTINPRTPKAQSISYSVAACSSMVSGNNSSLHSISMAIVQTPPAKRHQRVKNPFEAALAERLHLPLIASPSLFQRPNTPQMSSTQLEWTIDELSCLKPANVEAHETQFQESPDPELEAKAQSAISSYFKEQQIVPSPIDCPLRSHRIILSEINGNTPLSKPGRRIRDCASQTELTLPPILPPTLEEALKPYFQPHLAGDNKELEKSEQSRSWKSNSDVKDISLRRKLFDIHNIDLLENGKTLHQQSVSLNSLQKTTIAGKLSDSLEKSSFGSLSPILASESLSPQCVTPSVRNRFGNLRSEVEELLSPIQQPSTMKTSTNNTSSGEDENERFTPEISSSPLDKMVNYNIAEFSADSFNIKVSRLKVNSSKTCSSVRERNNKSEQNSFEIDIFQHDDTVDGLENTVDMDDMHVSQLSGHSSNCSSSQSDTPRGKRRSASRKNLSQSFTANWLQDEDEDELETSQTIKIKEILAKKQFTVSSMPANSLNETGDQIDANTTPKKALTFYRADSGFNEMSQNSSSTAQLRLHQQDILVCCSTPSTKENFNFLDACF